MGSHPINLFLRFFLEITALISAGIWGWKQSDDWLRFVLSLGIPMLLTVLWGVFAVPNDPSRSGSAPVPIPGFVRLILELGFFGFAVWALYDINWDTFALIFGLAVLAHYLISYDRVGWLLKRS